MAKKGKPGSDRFLIFLGKVFIILIITAGCVAGVEAVVRHFNLVKGSFDRRFPVQDTRAPEPYSMFKGKPGALDHNENGYRGPAAPKAKPAGEYRVFVLGGSTVYEGNPPIARLLEQKFREHGYFNVSVYNYGVVSSVSSMELARIVFEILDLQPDLVVMYNGGNDADHPYYWDPRPGYPFNFVVYENNPFVSGTHVSVRDLAMNSLDIFKILLKSSYVNRVLHMDELRASVGHDTDPWRREIARIYVNNLVKAQRICSSFNAEFVCFYQPMLYTKDVQSEEEQRLTQVNKDHHLAVRDYVLEMVQDPVKDQGLKFVDLGEVYDGYAETVFRDRIHTHQHAKPVIAEHMFEYLTGNLAIPQ